MIGIVVALIMILFRVDLTTSLLAFIGFELFGISYNLSYFRMVDRQKRHYMGDFMEGLRKGLADARRNEANRRRSESGNGEGRSDSDVDR